MKTKTPTPSSRNAAKSVALLATVAVFVLFWDSLLPTIGHVLHLLIEVVELPLEHLLEWAFHVSPRQAQGILAWTAAAGLIYLTVKFVRIVDRELRLAWQRLRAAIDALKAQQPVLLRHPATTITLTLSLIGALAYVMF